MPQFYHSSFLWIQQAHVNSMNENKIKYAIIEYHKMHLNVKCSPYAIVRTLYVLFYHFG